MNDDGNIRIGIVVLALFGLAAVAACAVLALNDKAIDAFVGLAGVAFGGVAGVVSQRPKG